MVTAVLFLSAFAATPLQADPENQKEQDTKIYEIGQDDVEPPKLIHVVEPTFDPKSEEAFNSGVVRMQIIVTNEGGVRDPKVLSGINERQNKKAMDAVKQWVFKPATRIGKPVNVRATVEVTFHLL